MTAEQAIALLGLDEEQARDEAAVRKAHRSKALEAHPDAGGSDQRMAEVNEARDVLLAPWSLKKKGCICAGFYRNPLCRGHDDEKPEAKEAVTVEPLRGCVCKGFLRNPLCKAH